MSAGAQRTVTLKASVIDATKRGEFVAVVSSRSIDREGDRVEPRALLAAIAKWAAIRKQIPLSWAHSLEPADLIGTLDPAGAHEVAGEVAISGTIDRNVPRGAEAWRLVKSGSLGFSIAYMLLDSVPRDGGEGRHVLALDLFEISATPAPMNADTRVLSHKALPASLDAELQWIELHEVKQAAYRETRRCLTS